MTIRFLQAWNGYFDGQIVASPRGSQSEAQLVSSGKASYDLDGAASNLSVAKLLTDPITGAVSLVDTAGNVVPLLPLATPEAYGAVGDGVTDDGAAWQSAVNASAFAGVRATPGKTYKIKNVSIPSHKFIDLSGAELAWGGSHGSSPVSENVSAVLYVEGTSGTRKTNIKIFGGKITGSRTGTDYASTGANEQDSISIQYADHVTISGVHFCDTKQDAVSLDEVTGVVVTGNYFSDSGDVCVDIRAGSKIFVTNNTANLVRSLVSCKPAAEGVQVVNNDAATFGIGITGYGANWKIAGNTLRVCTTTDAQNGATSNGIEIYETGGGATGAAHNGIVITGNTVPGRTSAYGVHLRDSTNGDPSKIIITDNYLEAQLGILVGASISSDGIVISGNIVAGGSGGGIWTNGGANYSIDGNIVNTTSSECIKCSTTGAVVQNNLCANTSAAAAIYLTSAATNSLITGNKASGATVGIITYAAGAQINNNSVASANGAGISVQGADATVSGNRIAATSGEAVLISAVKAAVTGNRMTAGTHGVRVSANDCTVNSNVISGMTFWGVNISAGANRTLVVANNLTNNTSGASTDAGTGSVLANNA